MGMPSHTQEAFDRYFAHAIEPGSFGIAVLCNNLRDAAATADHWNKQSLADIVAWLEQNAPRGSWGSPEIVQGWLNKNEWYNAYQKSLTFEILSQD